MTLAFYLIQIYILTTKCYFYVAQNTTRPLLALAALTSELWSASTNLKVSVGEKTLYNLDVCVALTSLVMTLDKIFKYATRLILSDTCCA